MELSILIVNWNTRQLLQECLLSIYSSVKHVPFEVIVVDNDSRDGSVEMVKGNFPNTRLIENRENAGFARGNNQAYRISNGRIVGLLNPDTIVYPDTFEKMVNYLDAHQGVGAVSCKFLNPDGSMQREFFRRFPTIKSIFFRYTSLGQRLNQRFFRGKALDAFFYKEKAFSVTETIEQPGAACLVMRRSLIEKIGLFDEQFPIFFNDVDLCKRIWDEGYEIHVLSDTHITHYGGGSLRKISREVRSTLAADGIFRYFKKHHGTLAALFVSFVLKASNGTGKLLKIKNA